MDREVVADDNSARLQRGRELGAYVDGEPQQEKER